MIMGLVMGVSEFADAYILYVKMFKSITYSLFALYLYILIFSILICSVTLSIHKKPLKPFSWHMLWIQQYNMAIRVIEQIRIQQYTNTMV